MIVCELCKTEIKEPLHIEINAILIKHDVQYVGSISFTLKERKDFTDKLICHKSCWQKLLEVKKDKKMEVK